MIWANGRILWRIIAGVRALTALAFFIYGNSAHGTITLEVSTVQNAAGGWCVCRRGAGRNDDACRTVTKHARWPNAGCGLRMRASAVDVSESLFEDIAGYGVDEVARPQECVCQPQQRQQ